MNNYTVHWANVKQIGPYWGMRFVLLLQRILGTRLCLWLILPVTLFYFVFNRHGRNASLDYLTTLKRYAPDAPIKPNLFFSFTHFFYFTEAILDKLATWNGKITVDDVDLYGREEFLANMANKRGAVILASHLGNIEVSRALASLNVHAKLNVLVHTKHARTFNRLLEHVSRNCQVELLEVTSMNPAMAILLQQKVDAGEFICIVGDRIPIGGHGRTVMCDFLGKKAAFAQGPFILANLLKCPVYTLFCLKQQGRYRLYFEFFAEQILLARKNKELALQQYAQQFAQRLEHYCLRVPLQWFNFYFYWQD